MSFIDLPLHAGAAARFESNADGSAWTLALLETHAQAADCAATAGMPLALQTWSAGTAAWHLGPYRHVVRNVGTVVAQGELHLPAAVVSFKDIFSVENEALRLDRTVRVRCSAPHGQGYLTAFALDLAGADPEDPWFIPGVWYAGNDYAAPYAVGSREQRARTEDIVYRADRLPLPLTMHYDAARGLALALLQVGAQPDTVAADDLDEPLIDARLGFGSFARLQNGRELAFWFPGTEGDGVYPPMWALGIGNQQADSPVNPFADRPAANAYVGWNRRYHPLSDGAEQRYTLYIDLRRHTSYFDALKDVWRRAWDRYRPQPDAVDLMRVEDASIDVLRRLVVYDHAEFGQPGCDFGYAPDFVPCGVPTWIDCFTAQPGKLQNTFGVGFVARNLEIAYCLLQAGHARDDGELLHMGCDVVDFWVRHGGRGLTHTEYDRSQRRWVDGGATIREADKGKYGEDGSRTFVFLRDQSEAHRLALRCWALEKGHGCDRPEWYDWAACYGAWLLEHQNADGSFFRTWYLDGEPSSFSTADGSHAVTYLLELAAVTAEEAQVERYVQAAEATAAYLWTAYHSVGAYLGGTLDNPNCTDKEAAALAMEAYLRLYERTQVRHWLDAAEHAATFCESWVFGWNLPMPLDEPHGRFFPHGAATAGYQLITTGFSAFDIYLTRHVGDFCRLAELTNDHHYRDLARVVLYNTKNTVQLAGEHGFPLDGLQIEHWSMGRGRGFGLNSGFLPWTASSHILSIEDARRYEAVDVQPADHQKKLFMPLVRQ